MKAKVFNAHNKYIVLQHALKENNVSSTCELFGISRTTYYNWKKAYEKNGMIGLEIDEPKKPKMPNKVNKTIENEILTYVKKFPTDGPNRIYYELKAEGFDIGVSGIYNVLKRYNLSRKNQRIEYSHNKSIYFNSKKRIKKPKRTFENIKNSYPGYLVIQRIDYIGTFEGIGKIYQYSIYDTYSKWGSVKLYNKKQDIDIWYYFELKLGYLMRTFNISIENLVTQKTKVFVPYYVKNNNYKEIIGDFNIKHEFIPPSGSKVLDELNDFNELLIKEFYNKIQVKNNIKSFIDVEIELHKFLRYYNFAREIISGHNLGKVPAKVMLERAIHNNVDMDTLPLWTLTLINSIKEGD
jgi:transposase/predicted DNA-binding protein YlxM (UPF0122 family)